MALQHVGCDRGLPFGCPDFAFRQLGLQIVGFGINNVQLRRFSFSHQKGAGPFIGQQIL
ncbi:hypothetical protein D3C75_1324840 [compost metagenome]